VVDVANVMGARADGWWRDRSAAALRLGREVMALAFTRGRDLVLPGNGPAGAWVLVVEGKARAAAELLTTEAAEAAATAAAGELLTPEAAVVPPEEALPGELIPAPPPPAGAPLVRVVAAPGSGDDAIVGVVAEVVASDAICLVVTADRELRQRCEDLNATVVGPGWLLRLL
jgi:hypothetical protein